jgi:hypothetical protein
MSNKEPKSLGQLALAKNSAFSDLTREAERRINLSDHLRNRLSEDLAQGVNSCNLSNDGMLTILTNSAAWASRLRFESEQILNLCREIEPSIANVRFKVSNQI